MDCITGESFSDGSSSALPTAQPHLVASEWCRGLQKSNAQTCARGSRIPASATEFFDLFTISLTLDKPKAQTICQKYATLSKFFEQNPVDRTADKTLYL